MRGIEEGKADIGFGNSISTVDASSARRRSTSRTRTSATSRRFYPQYFQVVVLANSGINSIKDLKGKALTTQPRGNTAEEITEQLLQVNGLTYNDVKTSFVSYTDAVTQMQDGHAQAFTPRDHHPGRGGHGPRLARDDQAARSSDSLDGMRKLNPGYTLVTVPKGTYPKQDQDVKVIGYATHIVASCKLPEDTVYG